MAVFCKGVAYCLAVVFLVFWIGCSSGETNSTPTPTPTPPSTNASVDVTTFHNDNSRSGQNLSETVLTLGSVNSTTFGKLGFMQVDGKVDGQPLVLSALNIAGQMRNMVAFVVTEHASVYAFDADSFAQIWSVSALGAGETPSDDRGCGQITPEIGITATPVIDRARAPNGAIYVVAMSKDSSGNYHQRIHALDITTGAELSGSPKEIQASYPVGNAAVVFDPKRYAERAGLLLLNGQVYTGWTSHCDIEPYSGWLMAFDAATLNQTATINLTPNGREGSIWMSGGGIAADGSGNIFVATANGTFDTALDANGFPSQGDFGNAALKLSTSSGLAVSDYFTPFDTVAQSNADADLGSGGVLLLPDVKDASGNTRHLLLAGGKSSQIYVVDRDAMGHFNPSRNGNYEVLAAGGMMYSSPAYFNNTVYLGPVSDHLKGFAITNAQLPQQPTTATSLTFRYPGATPSISANGSSNGIVWVTENGSTAVLHAYNAGDLTQELYNSNQAGSRDRFGAGNKFITPTVANGKVFVGSTNGVAVFGNLQ